MDFSDIKNLLFNPQLEDTNQSTTIGSLEITHPISSEEIANKTKEGELKNQNLSTEDESSESKERLIKKNKKEKGGEKVAEEETSLQNCNSCNDNVNLQQAATEVPFCCAKTVSNSLTIAPEVIGTPPESPGAISRLLTPCLTCVEEPCMGCPEVSQLIIRGCIPFILDLPATDPQGREGNVCCEGEVCVDETISFSCPDNPQECPENPNAIPNVFFDSVTVEPCNNEAAQIITIEGRFRLPSSVSDED